MRILITGATGFVGKTLVPYLYSRGVMDICVLIRNNDKAKNLFNSLSLTFINNTEMGWREAVINYNPDITLHLATLFDTHCDAKNVMRIIESNIAFSTLLLEAVSHTNCKHFIK
jgi:CDP-paratose synthetase